MISLNQAEQRGLIRLADAATIASQLAGPSALSLDATQDQLQQGPVILDGLRRRPRYFDGRFLTGADLTRDQDYVRQRQADMARAGGVGVISGLHVSEQTLTPGQTLSISPGLGLTPSGDLVMVSTQRDVPLLDLPSSRQLDAALGLSEIPSVPLGRSTGLYILALRPVEFSANPIAAYPRTITGKRTVEDGDIIEAAAITLIPYPDMAGAANIMEARRKVARAIFAGRGGAMPQDALPLAMLALDRGSLRWIDAAMVRRESGAESGVQAMLRTRPRAIAEAFVLQHHGHLADTLSDMAGRGIAPVFPAASIFSLLPPIGAMPAAALRPDDQGFTQLYFPPDIAVDVAFVPADEIPILAEEAMALPPIDLEAAAGDLAGIGVTMLVPVDRPRFLRFRNALDTANLAVATDVANPAPASAYDMVSALVARRQLVLTPTSDPAAAAAAQAEALRIKAWQSAFTEAVAALPQGPGQTPLVWFTRRRSIAQQPRVLGTGVAVGSDDVGLNAIVDANIDRMQLDQRLAAIDGVATPQAVVRLMMLLASPGVANSDPLIVSVISDVEKLIAQQVQPVATPPIVSTPPTSVPLTTTLPLTVRPAVLNPAVLATVPFASPIIARDGLNRVALASAAGLTTAARTDTPLMLNEAEVLSITQDYADLATGTGLTRIAATIGGGWPADADALWLGQSGRALAIDRVFRSVAEEQLSDYATLLTSALQAQDAGALDSLITKMS
jgi:hypothetical protein